VATRERLKELDIFTSKGPVPLRTPAHVEDRFSQTVITREDLENMLDITGYNRTRRISQVLEELGKRMKGFVFPGGYHMKMSGTAADMADSMPRVMKAVMLGLLLLLVLLIGIFQSFILPLPILLAGTVMTLIITPVTYSLLDDARAYVTGFFKGK